MSTGARIRVSAVAIGALVSFGLTAVDAQAGQIPFKPVADAHVSKVKKKANYGRSNRLVVSSQVTSYLKFNVRGLPGSVSFASLQLVAFNSSLSNLVVRRVSANHWRENAIRFRNAPKKFTGPTARVRRVKRFRVASIDVTKLVRGNGVVTLAVMTRGRGGASFASGESKEAVLRPLLIIGVNEAPVCRFVLLGTNEDTPGTADPNCTDAERDRMTYEIVSQGNHGTASIADGKLRYVPKADANGSDTFKYRAKDGRKWSKPVTVGVQINKVNDAPICHNVALAMDEDGGGAVRALCSDVDGDPLTVSIMQVAANGKSWEVADELRYEPKANFHGVDSFTYRARDTTLGSAPATVAVTVRPVNDAPTCAAVAFPTDEDAPREWDPSCSDIDGDPLGYGIAAHGAKGTASIAGGKLRYAPNHNMNGGDTFMYAASDGSAWSAPTLASVDILPVNDAPVCSNVTLVTEEEVLGEQDPACVDFDGDPLGYAIETQAQKGTASVGASKLRYLPNLNALGADSFTYRATDGTLTSAAATVSVTITPANDPPVCANVSLNVGEDTPAERDPSCTDVDGDPLTYEIVDQGAKGTGSVVGGRLRYVPDPNVFGSDSFTYRALDGSTAGAPATVSVSIAPVNDAPVCQPLPLDIAEDTSGEANPICSDIEGDPLTFSIVSQGTRGVASVAAGKLRYVPIANVNGADSFTYRAHDALTSSAATTVTVTIGAVNDAPSCSPVTLTTTEDTPGERDPVCSDIEGDALSYSIFAQGGKGTASVVGGKLRYVPQANANGADSFTYRATDGVANSGAATVSVSIAAVNDAPVCSAVALNIAQDLIGTVAPNCTDVELTRGETTTPLTYSIATQGAKGVASVVGSNLVYDPNPGATGADTFTYTARDGALTSAAAPVNVNIGDVNDPPSCLPRSLTLAEDSFGTVAPSCSDPENDPLTYSIVAGQDGTKGTASVVGGQLRYDADPNANGADSFSYVARDGALTSAPATVSVTITPVNDAPICSDVALSTSEDLPNEQNPSCSDVDGNTLTYSIVAGGTKGTASIAAGKLRFVPSPNANGADSFTYRANDGTVNSNVSTVSVTITPVNDAPTCSAVSLTTNEDVAGEADPTCSDVENDPLTYSIVTPPAPTKGTATVNAGKLRFAPNLNATGADGFAYRAFDGSAFSGAASVAVTITAVNDAPVCVDVPLATNEDTQGERDPSCSDVEGNPLTYSIVAPATRGTASVVAGKLRYVPGANENGLDSFTYRANDGTVNSNVSTVSVTIAPVNDAPSCSTVSLATNEDVPGEANPNCSDVDGDSLNYSIASQGAKGTASVVVASGRLRYVPDPNVNGADSFTYRASDPGGLSSAAATTSVSIAAVNDAPVCQAVSKELDEDSNITISPSCTDVEGSPLTYTIRTQPSQGTATVEGSVFRYVAFPNATGGDSFTYDASDGTATSAPATVTVTVAAVNDPPVCQARTLLVDEDATFGAATPVCTDPEGDPLTYSIPPTGQGTKGTAQVVGGNLHYTPNLNANGLDSFTYVASDGQLASAPATVSVTITPVNDAPVCGPVTLTTNEDVAGERDPSCSDVDGDALNYSIVAQGNKGTASVVTGKLRYVPSANANGGDNFTYRASDGTLNSAPASATVTITPVNDAPVCQPLPLSTNEDTPAEINPSCSDIDGDTLTYSIATQGTKGAASIAAGRLRYVPAANQNGADSFTYVANDPLTSSAPATVTVTIAAVNDAPTCVDRALALDEDTTASVPPLCTDVEGDPMSFAIVGPAGKGTATVVAGALRYAPNLNANGADSFTYRANDGSANGPTANVAVTIRAVNDAPVCAAVTLVTGEDSPGETDPSCSDVDGNPLTYSIVAQGPKGTASISGTGRLRYAPNLNVHGSDTFTYSASDGSLLSSPADANVTIQPVNDAPVCIGVSLATNEDTPGETDPSCSDVDGNPLTYSIAAQGAKGTASVVVATGKLRYVPTLNANGGDTFTYLASDGLLSSSAANVTVAIAPVNDAPACANVAFSTDEDVSADADPICTDVDGGVLTYSIVGSPSIGTATVVASKLRYTPNPNSHSSDSFTYRATDGGGLQSPAATATVTIRAVNDAPVCSPVTLLTTEDAVGEANPSCSDVDGDPLTYSIASQGSVGTASVVAGKLSYAPNADVTGSDSFSYRATDGGGLASSPAMVSVTIGPANDAPGCSNVSLATNEDTMAERDPSCTDIDNDPLTYSIEAQGAKGTASVVGNKLRYVPNADANGADTFTYKAHDGVRFSAPASVSVTIAPVNDRPVCADIGLVTDEEVAGERDPSCIDVDGDALTVSTFGQGTKGTASMAGTRLRYVPRLNENGPDSFTYRADDGFLVSAAATVAVEILPVNDLPQCTDVSFAANEDVLSEGDPSCTDVDGDTLSYAIVLAPSRGTASVAGNKLRYLSNLNLNGPDNFTYRANDGTASSVPATASVAVAAVNDAPTCAPLNLLGNEDAMAEISPSCSDVEGDPITVSVVSQGQKGAVSLVAGKLRYVPQTNTNGLDSFTYRASDAALDGTPATVSVNIAPVNDAPVCSPVSLATDEDVAAERDPSCTDIDGDPLTYSIFAQGTKGSATVGGGKLRYTPSLNLNGSDTFTYRAHDATTASAAAPVSVTIAAINDAPACPAQSLTIDEDSEGSVTPVCSDPENDPVTLEIAAPPVTGSASVVGGSLRYVGSPNANGLTSFTYRARDTALAASAAATVSVTIRPVNDAPVCTNLTLTTAEDTLGTIDPVCTEIDAGDTLTYSIVGQGSKGQASVVSGQLRFAPNANLNGPDSFTYKASDGSADSNSATVSVGITPVNDAPVAQNLSFSTLEDTARALTLSATDVDGDVPTFTIISAPTNGTLSGTGANRTYTPAANYFGPDSFTYRANDGLADSNVATVSLTVTAVNDAPVAQDLSVTTTEDTAKSLTLSATDVEGSALTFTIVSGPANGALTGSGANRTYTPAANFSGPDSFTYRANDGAADSNVATVSITVDPANDAPSCPALPLTVDEDGEGFVTPFCVDPEGDTLALEIVSQGSKGSASVVGGSLRYVANPNLNGADSFTYRATDGVTVGAPATVSVTITPINDAPTCANVSLATNEDAPAERDPACTDVDNASLNYSIDLAAANGSASVVGGKLRYAPNANFNGTDSFTYRASDGTASSAPATVSVTIAPVNDAPTCSNVTLVTDEDVPAERDPACTDVDNASLTYSIASQGSKGTASVTAGGKLRYVPNLNANGGDSFSYQASDGSLSSSAASVSVTISAVNDAPTCSNVALATSEDVPAERDPACTDVENTLLTYSIVAQGSKGTASVTAGGKLRYVPNPDEIGADSFTYQASDGTAASAPATVSVTIGAANDAPVAQDLSASTPEDTAKALTLAATDVEGDPLTYSIVTGPAHGTLSGTGADRTYTPNANYHGADSLTYRANDGTVDSNLATVTLTVTPVNDAPVAQDLSSSTPEDTAKALTLAATDVDGDALGYTIVAGPAHGTLSGTGAGRTYTPAANYNGPDSFTYKANDGNVDSNTATVTLTVDPVNDAPTCSPISLATDEDVAVEGDPVCTDVEGHALTYSIVTQPGKGAASVVGGRIRYVPGLNATGSDSFTYRASDAAAGAPATVSVDITPVNDAPFCPAQSLTIDEDSEGSVTPFCTDPEGNPITLEIVDQGLKGTASVVANSLRYVASPSATGADSFTYRARDAGLAGAPATVSVTISAVNDPPSCADLTLTTDEDVPAERDPSCTDVDSASLTYSIASQGSKGTASVTAGGKLRYVPNANAVGADSFTYRASDGSASSAPATVSVTITGVNDAPTCADVSLTTNEDVSGERDPACTDVDGGTLTYEIVTDGTKGSATVGAGKLRYAPNANLSGADTFTYRATDGTGLSSAPATVSVTIVPVNDAPVAQDLSATTPEDTAKALTLAATDVDSGSLGYTIVAGPAHGTLSGSGADRTYTPAANYNGPDSFTYKANDGSLDSNVATVSLTVDPVNDAPACSAASLTIDEDSEGSVTPVCTDPEGSAVSLEIAAQGAKGTASVVGNSLRYVGGPNANGADSFTFRASDGSATGSPATVSVTINPLNDAPTCSDVALTTTEDVTGERDPACTDVEGDSLTYEIVGQGTIGTASVVDSKLRYVPNPNTTGTDSFTYRASDGTTASGAAIVSVTITAANDPPLCSDVTLATDEDTAAAVDPACTDVDGAGPLTYSIVLPPAKGSTSIVDGQLHYVPAADATGTDSFRYDASDGMSSSAPATVFVTIAPVNDAPVCDDVTLATSEDVPVEGDPACTDVDNVTLTYSIAGQGALGTASVAAGKLRYVPAPDASGPDTFTYEASDGSATSEPATASVSIAAANDAPVAEDLSATTAEDTAKALTLAASDADGEPVGFTIVSGPAHGSLSGTGADRTYTPNANYHGADSFTYRANDGSADSNVATVTLTVTPVNDAPVAGDLSASTAEDVAKALTLAASDVDGDSLEVTIVAAPAHGTLSGTGADRTYAPDLNYHGADSFTYKANDGNVDSNVATVTLTVDPVNDAPGCSDVSLATDEDTAVEGDPVCTDVEGDALAYSIATQPGNGTASVVGGKLRYVPALNATGTDSFTYRASDSADGAPATVSVTIAAVNDPPVCAPASLTVDEDAEGTVAPSCVDPEDDAITLEVVDQGLKGSASVVGSSLRYVPAPNVHGSDSFTYRAGDGTLMSAPAIASVTINPVNDAPVCVAVDLTTDEDAAAERDPACTDIDGDTLTYSIVADGTKGSASVSAGRLRYTPGADANGADTFTYRANDATTSSAAATVSVTINPLNDAPTCAAVSLATDEGAAGERDPACADVDGDPLTYSIVADGTKGSASVVAGKLRYMPNPSEFGEDSFTYRASDGSAVSAAATVSVTIVAVNDAPSCSDLTLATDEDVPVERDPACTDPDNGSLSYSIAAQGSRGTASVTAGGKLRYVPNANASGDDSFTYQANDGAVSSAAATVSVTIAAVNDAPAAQDLALSTPEDTAKALALAAPDVEGDPISFTIVSIPTHGTLSGTGANRTYTPDANYHGSDSFTYQANDGSADSNVATVTLTVTPVNDAPVALDLSASTPEDTAKALVLSATDLDGDAVSFTIVSAPAHGTLSGTGADRTYTPAANYHGSDSFTYRASDADLDSNVATVSLTVDPVNDAPACSAETLALDEDASADVTPVCTDVEGDALSLEIVDQGLKGAASVVGDSLRYAAASNAHGDDSFTYRASDGAAVSAAATVSVTIASVNDAPACANTAITTDEDIAGEGDPVCTDADGDSMSYSIAAQGAKGTASVVDGKLRYVPNANANGGDSFTYQANDGAVSSAAATVSVTIAAVNDAPSCAPLALTTDEDVAGERDPACTDIDGDALTYSIGSQGSIGTASVVAGKLRYLSNLNANGSDTFSYVADDGLAASAADVSVTIRAVNDAPTCADVPLVTDEDVVGVRDPACTDVDGDQLTYAIIGDGTKGTASVVAGKLRYVPDPNVNGTDSFTYRALDASTFSGIATVSVTITPVNDAPTCADVALATDEDTPAERDPSCTDIDGGVQTYSIVSQPTKGAASVVDGKLRYVPALNATGSDSFTYRASDPAASAPATVSVTINAVNDAPVCANVALATDEDTQGSASSACVDPESDPFSIEIVAPATQGSASVDGSSLRYLPNANVTGSDSFTYRASDGLLWGAAATVSVTINPVNDAPVCAGADLATDEDVPAERDPVCSDIDSGSLTYSIASQGGKGSASVTAEDKLRYAPNANATGADSFTYQASDGTASSAAATVSVTIAGVNDAPICADVPLAVVEDTPAERDPSCTEVDGESLTYEIVTDGSKGTASVVAGKLRYAPSLNATGGDTFTYRASDGALTSAAATVTVTIAPANDAPSCADVGLTVTEDTPGERDPSCTDIDGDVLTYEILGQGAKGTASVVDGKLRYAPNANATGADSFTYRASDGSLTSASATVSVTIEPVNDAPACAAVDLTTDENVAAERDPSCTDPENDPLTYSIVSQGTKGTASVVSGRLRYVPNAGQTGADSFTYRANDGGLDSPAATVSVTIVSTNDPPTCANVSLTATEDTMAERDPSCTDPESDPLTYSIVSQGAKGTASVVAGKLRYVPNANATGGDSFTYRASDATLSSAPATVTVTITPVNDAPVCPSPVLTIDEETDGIISPACVDPEGDQITLSIADPQPANGTAGIFGAELRYVPNVDFHGVDAVKYRGSDGQLTGPIATVSIVVNPVNDEPEAIPVDTSTPKGVAKVVTLDGFDFDTTDTVSFRIISLPANGVVRAGPNATDPVIGAGQLPFAVPGNQIRYEPAAGFTGVNVFQFVAHDGTAAGFPADIRISVLGANVAPVCTSRSLTLEEDSELWDTGICSDADGDPLTFTRTGPSNGQLTIFDDASFNYVPDANYHGPDSFTISARDPSGLTSAVVTVTLTITSVNDAPTCRPFTMQTTQNTPVVTFADCEDVDEDSLTYVIVSQGTKGTASVDPDNRLRYVPNAGATGADAFTFTVSDGVVTTSPQTANVSIAP